MPRRKTRLNPRRVDGVAIGGERVKELSLTPTDLGSLTIEPGTTIRLAPGIYTVRGPWTIPPRCKVIGAGMWNTKIESSDDRTTGIFVVGSDCFSDGCITISDLTINGKFSLIGPNIPLANRKIDGLVLFGNHNVVERVRVINWGGTSESASEAYGILLSSRKTTDDVFFPTIGSKVRDCIVYGGSGDYDNGVASGPISHDALIEGCTVYDVMPVGGSGHGAGLALIGTATFRNNTTHRCLWGFHAEAAVKAILEGNQFLECAQRGARLSIGARLVTIAHNLFTMQPGAIAIEMGEQQNQPVIATRIESNTLEGGGILLPTATGRGQIVRDNFCDGVAHTIAPDALCSGNRTLTGGRVASLPDRKGNWKK